MKIKLFSVLIFFFGYGCSDGQSKKQVHKNEKADVFDEISSEVCKCVTESKASTFAIDDSCSGNAIEKHNSQLKELNIDVKTVGGTLRVGTELHSRLSKNCPYFVEKESEFLSAMELENKNLKFKGSFISQEKLRNGDYLISLDSANQVYTFFSKDSIDLKKIDNLSAKGDMVLIVYDREGLGNIVRRIQYIER